MRQFLYSAAAFALFAALFVAPRSSQAQITERILANIPHPFMVNNTTLPPGRYTFHMMHLTNQTVMRLSSADGRTATDFLVRDSIDDHVPKHSELVFNRYGNEEFLTHIYEAGTKTGAAVVDVSREESGLRQHGQKAFEHTEEQEK